MVAAKVSSEGIREWTTVIDLADINNTVGGPSFANFAKSLP